MKTVIFGQEAIGFKISADLFKRYMRLIDKFSNDSNDGPFDEIERIKTEIRQTGKFFPVDYIASGDL